MEASRLQLVILVMSMCLSQNKFASQCISMDEGMHNILLPTATGYGKEITEAMGAPIDEMLSMQPASLCMC
jgi:hypothetical protein